MSGKDKLGWKQAIGMNIRVYKIWWGKYPRLLIARGLHAVVQGLSPYVGIFLVAQIINELVGARDLDRLMLLIIIQLASAAALAISEAAFARWSDAESDALRIKARGIYGEKMQSMDFVDIEKSRTKELLTRMNQAEHWRGFGMSMPIWGFSTAIRSIISIIGAIALTASLFTMPVPEEAGWITALNNPIFVLIIIAAILITSLISPALSTKAQSYWTRHSEEAKMGNRWSGFMMVMANELKRQPDARIYEQDKIMKKYSDLAINGGPLDHFNGIMAKYGRGPIGGLEMASTAVSHVLTAFIYIFVCLKAWGGAFAVGNITQYIRAITNLSRGISDLLGFLGTLRNNGEFLKDTFEFLNMPNNMYLGSLTTEKRSDHKLEIEFRNVSFKYPGNENEEYALRNVSIKFAIGQRMAIVGENGSGKTTFIKLLCRLYDPTEGEILLNGIDIRKYDYHEYMDTFSVVFQDFQLLAQGLGANVAAAKEFDADKVRECLIKSGFEARLAEMENGLDTCLYKEFDEVGVAISGGEAQKIALARALYKDAPFVILDEPTAALDPIAEYEVYSKMNDIVGTKTAIFISHRLSSCRFCGNIAVFDKGSIIQHGGHDDLVADKKGKYYQLWNAQAQYYSKDQTA